MATTVLALAFHDPAAAARAAELVAPLATAPALVEGTDVEVAVDDGAQTLVEALRLLDRAGLVVASVALREPSLDDVFLALTGHRAAPTGDDRPSTDHSELALTGRKPR
ncbi:MAG: DUF4162 domain-containing protein [Actinomycetota bacterium]|nr:DUF4162 domain-containing protein [Actinomycetota bacterium]